MRHQDSWEEVWEGSQGCLHKKKHGTVSSIITYK